MLQTAYKVSKTRNKYGDLVGSSETAITCKFRVNNMLVETGNSNTYESDALAWFNSDSGVEEGDVIKYDNIFYKVERKIEARKLHSTTVQFIKVELNRYQS